MTVRSQHGLYFRLFLTWWIFAFNERKVPPWGSNLALDFFFFNLKITHFPMENLASRFFLASCFHPFGVLISSKYPSGGPFTITPTNLKSVATYHLPHVLSGMFLLGRIPWQTNSLQCLLEGTKKMASGMFCAGPLLLFISWFSWFLSPTLIPPNLILPQALISLMNILLSVYSNKIHYFIYKRLVLCAFFKASHNGIGPPISFFLPLLSVFKIRCWASIQHMASSYCLHSICSPWNITLLFFLGDRQPHGLQLSQKVLWWIPMFHCGPGYEFLWEIPRKRIPGI